MFYIYEKAYHHTQRAGGDTYCARASGDRTANGSKRAGTTCKGN